jgi:hypothetical protein
MNALTNNPAFAQVSGIMNGARKATQAKAIEAQILMKRMQIKSLQQEFGVRAFPVMASGEGGGDVSEILAEIKAKVDAIETQIGAMLADIERLK